MPYTYGGLTLANVGDIVTQASVSTNFEMVLRNSSSGTAPVSPVAGQLWYNTTTKVLSQWDGLTWTGIGGGAILSGTPPASPQTGDLWYDSVNTGRMYIWNGTAWLDAAPAAGASVVTTGSGAPTPTTIGFNSQGAMYADITVVPNDIYISDGIGGWDLAGGGGGVTTFDALADVDVASKVTMQSGIMWNATAVSGGVTGQWVTNQIYDASPSGGASNDF